MSKPDITQQIAELLENKEITSVMPQQLNKERIINIIHSKALDLRNVLLISFLKALASCVRLSLNPESSDVYFFSQNENFMFTLSATGLTKILYKSEKIKLIQARAVYQNDHFECIKGTHRSLSHNACLSADRGSLIGFYALVDLEDNQSKFEFLTKAEIDEIRIESRSFDIWPWTAHYLDMAEKTVIKYLFKHLPPSILDNLSHDERTFITGDEISLFRMQNINNEEYNIQNYTLQ